MTVLTYSQAHGLTTARVYQLLKANRIPGAQVVNGGWVIPDDAGAPVLMRRGRPVCES